MTDYTTKDYDVIYLQKSEFPETTWCVDRINDDDIEYLRATSEREAAGAMHEASRQALEDLKTWHTEAFAYTHPTQGHIEYGSCDGCDTCSITIPGLEAALALADGKKDNA